ncbi:hypothetical protein ACLK1T_24015 [Escherichia coli]
MRRLLTCCWLRTSSKLPMTTSRCCVMSLLRSTERYPVPTFAAAVAYYDSYRAAVLPANLIRHSVTIFGAQTYKRIYKEVCSILNGWINLI